MPKIRKRPALDYLMHYLGALGFRFLGQKERRRTFMGKVAIDGPLPDDYAEYLPGLRMSGIFDQQYVLNVNVSPLPIPVLHRGPSKEFESHFEVVRDLNVTVEDFFVSHQDGYTFVRRKIMYLYNNSEVASFLYCYAKT
jgi:hypothetical protein